MDASMATPAIKVREPTLQVDTATDLGDRHLTLLDVALVIPTVGGTVSVVRPMLGSCSFGRKKLSTTAMDMNAIANITRTAGIFSNLFIVDMLSFCIYSSIHRKEETMSRTEKRAEYNHL